MVNLNEVYNEDCLIGMKRIADGSIDMILVDPPYGITAAKHDVRIDIAQLWNQYKRIIKPNGAIVIFSQLPFSAELIVANLKMFRYEWIWEKPLATGYLNSHRMPLRAHENILVFYQKLPVYNPQFSEGKPYQKTQKSYKGGVYSPRKREYTNINNGKRYPRDIIKFKSTVDQSKERFHSTQKPVDLLEYLIKTYTNEGETVLDNCIGSGSTAVACVNTNRKFIGFETHQPYVEIAKRRIDEAIQKRSQDLFKLNT